MDTSTTLAVNILVKTSMGAAASQFSKGIERMERDVRNFVARINKMFASIKYPKAPPMPGTPGGGSTRTSSGGRDIAMERAQRDIERMTRQRKQWATDLTNHEKKQADQRSRIWARSTQQTAQTFQRGFSTMRGAVDSVSNHNFFKGIFWSTFGAIISARFIGAISSLPGRVLGILNQAIDVATQRSNAALGLQSVAAAKNVPGDQAVEAVKNLRLVKAGIVDIGTAATGLKNLLASGFGLDESIKLLEAFSDTAAFGKQNALTFGEAIRGATEGIKNGNSILVDNVGLTKNLSIILKEAGYAENDLMKATQDANIRRALYNGLLKEASLNLGDADRLTRTYTGTQAALNMSYLNYLDVVGQIITKNPEFIALLKTITAWLDRNTEALKNNADGMQDNANRRIATLSKMLISTVNFVDKTTALIEFSITGLSGFVTLAIAGVVKVAQGLGAVINEMVIRPVNLVLTAIDKLPSWAGGGGGQQGYRVPEVDTQSLSTLAGGLYNDALVQQQLAAKEVSRAWNRSAANWRVFDESANIARRDAARSRYRGMGNSPFADPNSNLSGTPDGDGATKKFRLGSQGQALVQAASILGVSPLDLATIIGYETNGSFSTGQWGGKKGNYMGLIQFGPEERRKYGVSASQTFEQQILNSVVPFFQDRFAGVGRSTAGATLTDLYKTVNAGNPNASIFASDRPGENIGTHVARMIRERKGQALNRFFGGKESNIPGVGKDEKELADIEFFTRLAPVRDKLLGLSTTGGARQGGISADTQISTQLFTQPQMYVQNLREGLELEQRTTNLAVRRLALQGEITARVEDYILALEEAKTTNEADLAVAQARLPLIEAQRAFEVSRIDQVTQARDIERDMATLRLQNMDAAFVAQRQFLMAKEEEYQYQQDITDLQDRLATQNVNQDLRIQLGILQDIYEIREREAEAILRINRANLEIQQQTVYSANQANAQVLEFLASQKGVTETMADFRIGLIESGYDLIDSGLDKIIPKMGRLTDVVKDLLSSFIRLALNSAFRRLFGLDAGGSGGGGGAVGGGGGFNLGSLLFGGGGGSTPGFNPNASVPGASGGGSQGGGIFGNIFNRLFGRRGTSGQLSTAGMPGISDTIITPDGRVYTAPGAGTGTAQAGRSGGGLISGALQSQIMGALSGGVLGMGLGQGSAIGMGLGSVGGAIAGTLLTGLATSGSVSGAVTGGIFGKSAGLFGLGGAATFGIGLAIAGGLMLVSYLFGRSARRKREKREVERIYGDVTQKIQQLIADVKAFKIDGASAYQQGVAIRDQYQEEIAKLKTKPGKRLAQEKLGQINAMLATLKTEGDKADRVRLLAQETDERLIPTFASGGFTGMGRGLRIIGVHGHEAVLNQQNIMALGGYRALQNAGVKGVSATPTQTYERSYAKRGGGSSGNANLDHITVVAVMDEETADRVVSAASIHGLARKVRIATKDNIAGLYSEIENKLTGKR